MAKFFFTSGRVRPESKKRGEYDVKPIRPHYSEMGGGAVSMASGGSAGGGYGAGGSGIFSSQPQSGQSGANAAANGAGSVYDAPRSGAGGASAPSGGYDAGSFEDYYGRLISALHSYGIDMALPTLDELYSQLSAFLRPSVDAAIAGRQKYGETVMAELDADAYSRGMGSSSYLSSMKNREYDDIANDIAAMESNYNSTLAEYLYNASNELANIQAQFAAMNRQHELEMQRQLQQQAYENERLRRQQEFEAEQERLRRAYEQERLRSQQEFERAMREAASGGSRGSGSGGGKSTKPKMDKPGAGRSTGGAVAYTDTGTGSDANYHNYTVYMNTLSTSDRSNVFNSNSAYWTAIRDELRRNLSPAQYERLRAAFDPNYSGGGGTSSGHMPGRNWNVNTTN